MVHIKFDNGDSIAHDRSDPDCVVFDKDPDPLEIQVGTRVIAHWPSIGAYMAGTVIDVNGNKYHVEYYDGDKRHNAINQMRVLKPPVYFGESIKLPMAKNVFLKKYCTRYHIKILLNNLLSTKNISLFSCFIFLIILLLCARCYI